MPLSKNFKFNFKLNFKLNFFLKIENKKIKFV